MNVKNANHTHSQGWVAVALVCALLFLMAALAGCSATPEGDVGAEKATAGGGEAGPAAGGGASNDVITEEEFPAWLTAPPNPLDVDLELAAQPVVQTIGPEGGVIEVPVPDGRVHRVIFDPGTFLTPTEITATAVLGAEGMPPGTSIETGVQLEPHGLFLARPATVSLELPPGTDVRAYGVFSTLANGEQAYPTFGMVEGNRINIRISTFSSYNGGQSSAEAEQSWRSNHPVTSAGRRAWAEIGAIVNQGGPLSDHLSRLTELLNMWWRAGILPLAEDAKSDDIAMMKLAYEGLLYESTVQILGLFDDGDVPTLGDVAQLLQEPILNAYDRSLKRCREEHRLGEASYLLDLEHWTLLFGMEGLLDGVTEDIKNCWTFRLTFESTITSEGHGSGMSGTANVSVRGEIENLYIDSSGVLKAFDGSLEYVVAEGGATMKLPGGTCSAKVLGGRDTTMAAALSEVQIRPQKYGEWSVPEVFGYVPPPPDPEPGETIILLDPGEPREVVEGSCPGLGNDTGLDDEWDGLFWGFHLQDVIDKELWDVLFGAYAGDGGDSLAADTGFSFNLQLATPPGDVYASYEFNDCFETSGDISGQTCERTVITLYHEPAP